MEQAISVTTISSYLKNILDNDQLLYRVKVFGEVSSFNTSNGVGYFGLKDENALLNCVCFCLEDLDNIKIGEKVIIQGTPNYYIKGGRLSFNVEKVEKFGEGELYKNFLLLKQRLEKEGLFDIDRKKPMPKVIKKIGVVTSEKGAVLQDIINVSTRRDESINLCYFPVKVQGMLAEQTIVKGIEYFSSSDVDAIIVARGGGSEEDLAPFNTEVVVRAISNCPKFVVSAVGHQTNYTLVDFVADLRAPTPSAAAELLVKEKKSYKQELISLYSKLQYEFDKKIVKNENVIANNLIKINNAINQKVTTEEGKISMLVKELNLKNPLEIIAKGYSKIELDGKRVASVNQVEIGQNLKCNLIDGDIIATVKEINKKWIMKKR